MREAKGWEEDEKHCWVTGDREFWDVTWCYWEGCWHWLTLMFFPKYYRMSCDIIIRSMSCCCCCYITLVMSNSVRPHRRQPTRIPRPWDCPGKNTGAGCHFLLQCMKVKSESEVTQLCQTLSDTMDCSLPGSSVHGIFQARVLSGVPLPSLLKSNEAKGKNFIHSNVASESTKSKILKMFY